MKRYSKILLVLSLSLMTILCLNVFSSAKDIETKHKELIQALSDQKFDVRTKAAEKLGEDKVVAAIKPLVNMLKNDKVYKARITAALSLYKIGDKQVLPILKERAKADESKTVRTVLEGIIKRMEKAS